MHLLDRRFLDFSFSVIGILDYPPENTTNGSQAIVGYNPTGDFLNADPLSIARFDGSDWTFFAPKPGDDVFNIDNNEILVFNGNAWIVKAHLGSPQSSSITPVIAIVPTGDSLPATASSGDIFLNTSDAKLYLATDNNSWDNGTALATADCYASSSELCLYSYDGSSLILTPLLQGAIFFNKNDNFLYVKGSSSFIKASNNLFHTLVTETHSLSADEALAQSFSLQHSIAAGMEHHTLLFVSGIAQYEGSDFSASNNSISWDNKELQHIGLQQGDSFLIQYFIL